MTAFAELDLIADTSGLLKGEVALDSIARKAKTTETATVKMADRIHGVALKAAASLGALAAGFASLQTMNAAITAARSFNAEIANTATLIKGTPEQLAELEAAARRMAKTFGIDATSQVKGFYEALSAGSATVADAAVLMESANKLAVGGQTEVATAVDVLTTAMNVYSKEGLTAAQASDALFVTALAGKTTIGELSEAMGRVLPLAQNLGVSFDETGAAVAALTKSGLATSEAITGLRASMTAVLGPSKEARDLAKALGIDFSAAGLEAKGFAGFMEDVVKKTGGSSEAMQRLFGSTEATTVALSMAGSAGGFMSEILGQMEAKAGATDLAFQKVAESLSGRLNIAMAGLGDLLLRLGLAILPAVVAAMEALTATLTFVADHAQIFVDVLIVLAATQLPALVIGLYGLGTAAFAAIAGIDVLAFSLGILNGLLTLAGGPLGIIIAVTGALYLLSVNAGKVQQPMYDASAGTAALNTALRTFYQTGAPTAGAAAIGLANDNKKLAASAFEAAKAQLALAAAALAQPIGAATYDAMGNYTGFEMQAESEALSAATTQLERATAALAEAEAGAKTAAAAVTGSDYANGVRVASDATTEFTDTIDVNIPSMDSMGKTAGKAAKGLTAAEKAARELTKQMQAPFVSAIESVSGAFGDFISGGLKDFKGFVKSIVGSFKQMISQLISTAISNPIKIAMGLMPATPGAAIAGAATGGAAPAAGGAGGILSSIAGFGTSLFQGAQGFFSSLMPMMGVGGGLSGGLSYLTANITGAISGTVGLGAAIGAIAAPLLAVAAVFSFFKTKTKLLDSGLRLTVNGLDTAVETFKRVKKTRFWGLSSKKSTSYEDAAAEVADPISKAIGDMQQGIIDMAGLLGIGSAAFETFSTQLKISTKGLSESDALAAVQKAISGLGDEFADLTTGLAAFKHDGEGAMAALTRLTQAMQAVNLMADTLGLTFRAAGLIGADMASQLADAFGGLDALNTAVGSYYSKFYTEAERNATATRQATEALAKLNASMPTSRDEYRAMIEAQDLTTESGRALFAALVSMSGIMDQVLPQVSAFSAAVSVLVGNVQTNLGAMIVATGKAQSDALAAADAWRDTAKSLRKYVSDMRASASPLITAGQALAYNQSRFDMLMGQALGGNLEAAGQLTGAADALLDSSVANAHTSTEAAIAQAQVLAGLTQVADSSDVTAATMDSLATLLGEQLTVLQTISDYLTGGGADAAYLQTLTASLSALQGQLGLANTDLVAQLTAPMGVLTTGLASLVAAINLDVADRAARAAADAASQAAAAAAEGIRLAEAAAAAEVARIAAAEAAAAAAAAAALAAAAQAALDALPHHGTSLTEHGGIRGFAAGGDHPGGLRIVGERGRELEATGPSRIFNAAQTERMLRGRQSRNDDALVVRELQALRSELADLKEQHRQINGQIMVNSKRSRNIEESWDAVGMPPVRA